ncbi:aldose 1-epimerase family protein [Paraburkholderia sp. J8-2]|uniref:aldose 1-epimerase family protein n=1 Tax=Paraburkholderia sp. J8-2 TaxID=2805440 RepID=UPI002AB6BC3C|nr:aldose 1-epimerase family protein [Paraburkholderia sp. J8-2]
MTDSGMGAASEIRELPQKEWRKRTVDGRGIADIRLLQVEDGPGRGQRLLFVRNATGIGLEIAVDRGFDISAVTWRGVNIGWNSANGMPWPPHSVDAEDGVGLYRNLDGFLVTCGLDHIGGARRDDGGRYIHKHRKEVFHPLHGRISSQRALLCGYGIDWHADEPVIWAEGVIRQSAVFGENLVLKRRITLSVHGGMIHVSDTVQNQGFRPTPHAILYHINFGYPFLDEATQIAGDLCSETTALFNAEDKRPRDDFVDYYQGVPVTTGKPTATIEVRNGTVLGGLRARISYRRSQLPVFGIWRAFQSGIYALGLEPARPFDPQANANDSSMTLEGGESRQYAITLELGDAAKSGACE